MVLSGNLFSLYDYAKAAKHKSFRVLASLYRTSPASIFRKFKKIKSRSHVMGAEFFETVTGQEWLIKMVVACILVFGIICGIGSERLSLFFSLLSLTAFVGLSPRSIGRIEERIEGIIDQYRATYDAKIKEAASDIDITVGADETFFKNLMILVLMDLKSGFIFFEKPAEDRKHKTWDKLCMPWLSHFKNISCMVSDRAKALIKLAHDSVKKASIPDLFHLMQDVSKAVGSPIAKKIAVIKKQISTLTEESVSEIKQLEQKRGVMESSQRQYAKYYRRLSTTLHPFKILTSEKQDTLTVQKEMLDNLDAIEKIKNTLNLSTEINKTRNQIVEASEQVNIWWNGVNNSLSGSHLNHEQKEWLMDYYLPVIYWQKQVHKTDSKQIKKLYILSLKHSQQRMANHNLSASMMHENDEPVWNSWASEMSNLFQRASSAVEGRNGWLSQMHFCGRGLTEKRLRTQTTLSNYFLKRDDQTTACERLSGIKPECLFEFILKNIGPLPEPRKKRIDSG